MEDSNRLDGLQGKKIFVTGASGVVGTALLDRLPSDNVICLVHRTTLSNPTIKTISGDIRQPRLGLEPRAYAELCDQIGWIVHGAANTCFAANAQHMSQLNVEGTGNLLSLAAAAQAPMTYISTAFVHPLRALDAGDGFNIYEESKRAAERLVRQSDVPVTIVRPSIVIGDSVTGHISGFQGLHHILGLIFRNQLPVVPASRNGRIDFIPQDYVARAIANLIAQNIRGGDYWLTAGTGAPVFEALLTTAVRTLSAFSGRSVAMPSLACPRSVPANIGRLQRQSLSTKDRKALKLVEPYRKYLSREETLPSSFGKSELASLALDPQMLKSAFIRNTMFWAESDKPAQSRNQPAERHKHRKLPASGLSGVEQGRASVSM